MKLVRFGAPGAEKPGLVDSTGTVRDLSGHVRDITGDVLSPASLAHLKTIDPKSLPEAPKGVRLGAPVGNVKNFMAIGLNYADHAKETGSPIPAEPTSAIQHRGRSDVLVHPSAGRPSGCLGRIEGARRSAREHRLALVARVHHVRRPPR